MQLWKCEKMPKIVTLFQLIADDGLLKLMQTLPPLGDHRQYFSSRLQTFQTSSGVSCEQSSVSYRRRCDAVVGKSHCWVASAVILKWRHEPANLVLFDNNIPSAPRLQMRIETVMWEAVSANMSLHCWADLQSMKLHVNATPVMKLPKTELLAQVVN